MSDGGGEQSDRERGSDQTDRYEVSDRQSGEYTDKQGVNNRDNVREG